jgi:hypothetical protein
MRGVMWLHLPVPEERRRNKTNADALVAPRSSIGWTKEVVGPAIVGGHFFLGAAQIVAEG